MGVAVAVAVTVAVAVAVAGSGVGVAVGGCGVAVGFSSSRASSVATRPLSALTSLFVALFLRRVETVPASALMRSDRPSSVSGDCACSCETPSAQQQ